MWVHEYTAETAVSPEAIWAMLSDLDRWPRWDTSMERVALQGPEITADFPEAMDGLLACAVA
jgi:hypothetical protein